VEFDEASLVKALGVPPRWKVPNDYAGARRAANAGAPLISNGSPVGRVLREMARAACGKPPEKEKKKGFSLFG
jgi:pilus assembly protein CpaE